MTKYLLLSRSTTSAIAALLALSTPVAFAQEASTVPMTPPVAAPTTPPPTVQPPGSAAAPAAPPPVIRVPTVIETPAAPKAAERAAAVPAREARPAPRQRAAAPAPVEARAAAPAEPAAPVLTGAVAPLAAPVAAPVQPVAEPAPVPARKAAANGDGFAWEMAGGAAALLLVGGAAFAFSRRRRASSEVWEFDESHRNDEWVPPAEPVLPRAEAAPPPEPEPARAVAATPAFAGTPAGSIGRHQALAMAGPTPDNPFTTLGKRLARARFLDRQERAEYAAALVTSPPQAEPAPPRKPVSAWEISQRQTGVAPTEQEVRRLDPGSIRKGLKPGWTRG